MPSDTENIVRKAGRAVGRVQGVGFRVFVRNSAKDCGVTGWVKNMNDGSVTMELQGASAVIETLIDKIKTGRGRIKVNEFELSDLPVVEGEKSFAIRK
ncbi:MAG: acylphosphatase [Selenomonadaceae bacterium]|nr:acylphosphatase [Selenomonadaceae bacterium]